MKKFCFFLLCAVMALTLTACGSEQGAAKSDAKTSDTSAAAKAPASKTLVVYYSASGRTEQVANDIAKATGADTFRLQPSPDYTDADLDYHDENSRVMKEHNDPSLREAIKLKETNVPNWDQYDTVYIGFPIWWGIEAWPVDPFVKANDFTGKKVIVFATAYSSPLGTSGENLKALANGKGDWQDGECFTGAIDDQKVMDWAKSVK